MKVISIIGQDRAARAALTSRLAAELRKSGTVGTILQDDALQGERYLTSGVELAVLVSPGSMAKITGKSTLNAALDALASEAPDYAIVDGFEESVLPKIAIGAIEATNVVATAISSIEELVKITDQQPEYITLDLLVTQIKRSPKAKYAGSIGTFTGMVREIAEDEKTKALEFESYGEIARERINAIAEDLKKRKGILEVLIHHKTGRIEAGEDIVFIVILSGHREELFPALRDAIDRVKAEVPIWKKEMTVSGEYWVHDVH